MLRIKVDCLWIRLKAKLGSVKLETLCSIRSNYKVETCEIIKVKTSNFNPIGPVTSANVLGCL